jgi:TIGR03009 family protein
MALASGALLAQDPPRRPPQTTARAKPPANESKAASVYGPAKQPSRQAATGTRPTRSEPGRGGALNQFVPRQRPPQASWGQLTLEEYSALELVLEAWEKRSGEVKTLECVFQTWKYDKVFGKADKPSRVCRGVIRYAAPDKGHYHITEEAIDPAQEKSEFVSKEGEHWVCDGNAVYEFDQQKKQLIERRLPQELKGKAISNSPLPFVFGTTAAKMRQRYWLRLTTPRELKGKEIWLEVEPIYPEDRANYQSATVILAEKQMLPKAVSLELPNGSHTNYAFDVPSVNNPLKKFFGAFNVPSTPAGWKRIVEDPPPSAQPAPPSKVRILRLPQGAKRK